MNDYEHNHEHEYLPGSEEAEMNSLLNELSDAERGRAPSGLEAGVLDAIAGAMAPAPISIEQTPASRSWFGAPIRYAAAAALVGGAALSVMLVRPMMTPMVQPNGAAVVAVDFEADVESLLALDEVADELDETVAELSLWAQAVDSDLNSAWLALDLIESSFDENGAL